MDMLVMRCHDKAYIAIAIKDNSQTYFLCTLYIVLWMPGSQYDTDMVHFRFARERWIVERCTYAINDYCDACL